MTASEVGGIAIRGGDEDDGRSVVVDLVGSGGRDWVFDAEECHPGILTVDGTISLDEGDVDG